MEELAFYPGVALMYFFGVMKATQDDLVELDDRASKNVFLPVRAGTAAVSGPGGVHRHGYIPPHSAGLLQLPALEESACEGKGIKEEDKVRK
ncbi:hypothetical protein KUCAC02_030706 [Chaenocephalus aceratus]|uniref:Uncharacterized protein n=1 Tax=Chaenocephalus aceratus TaxID=36190 RepID=A0ACB9XJQ7_CHAAC|nr:hypothetical protein KUCAC02_030706 [Chaenocephalus aceratus]